MSWEKIKEGDPEAFCKLYNEYANMLYSYGMKIFPNSDLVSDAIQTLFMQIYEKRKNLSEPKSMISYLCASLKRMILREAEKETRNKFNFENETFLQQYDFELELDIENALIKSELHKEQLILLQKALFELTNKQREVIYLRYFNNLNNDEIAEVMNINNQSVRNLISQALNILRQKDLLKHLSMLSVILFNGFIANF